MKGFSAPPWRWAAAISARPRPIRPSARWSCAMAWWSVADGRRRAGDRMPKRSLWRRRAHFARGATLYVTLEPCAHHGKTPPCAEAVVAAGVTRVVGGLTDPDPRVAGQGFGLLRAHGIEVESDVLPDLCRQAHRGHILRAAERRPMVTLKIAQTADGQAAGGEHDQRLAITGLAANLRTHVLRAMHDAIMVGIGTVLGDDPLMTVRLPGCHLRPLRVDPRCAA